MNRRSLVLRGVVVVIAALCVSRALLVPAVCAQGTLVRVFLMKADTLLEVRKAAGRGDRVYAGALRRLQKDADKILAMKPVSVMDKGQVAPSGDKHDYLSLARYFWPDPAKPDGLPYIQRDGETNPECESVGDQQNLQFVMKGVATLGLAYFYTSNEEYAEHATVLLRTWFLDPGTRMNPNMNFGQIVKGKNVGRASGLIDARDFAQMIDGVGLLAGSASWKDEDQRALVAWFAEYLEWLETSIIGTQEARSENNHGVWFDVQRSSIALFVGRGDLARSIVKAAATGRIARQIEPDGTQPRELARTRSMHYTAFNLAAFFSLALLGDQVGIDLWSYRSDDGRSIRGALEWFLPYYAGEKAWEGKQIDAYKYESFYPVARLATLKYGDPKYAEAATRYLGDKAGTDRTLLIFGHP